MSLSIEDAYKILEIDAETYGYNVDRDTIKKKYRLLALKYHPDKSRDPLSKEKFIQIREAYNLLLEQEQEQEQCPNDKDPLNYDTMMEEFLNTIQAKREYILIIKRILKLLSKSGIQSFLKRINKDTLNKIREIIEKYRDAFHINEDDDLNTYHNEYNKHNNERNNECLIDDFANSREDPSYLFTYILNPFIEDLLEEKVFRLQHNDQTFLVPLWHQETIFEDKMGKEFRVCCYPLLPENMDLDDNNILSIWVDIPIGKIWNKETYEIMPGIMFLTNMLQFTDRTQEILIMDKGVSYPDPENMFAVKKQPVRIFAKIMV